MAQPTDAGPSPPFVPEALKLGPAAAPPPVHRPRSRGLASPTPGRIAAPLVVLLAVIAVDSILRSPGSFDYRLIREIHRLDAPGLQTLFGAATFLASPPGLLSAFAAVFVLLLVTRNWLEGAMLALVPMAAAFAWLFSLPFARELGEPGRVGASLAGRSPADSGLVLAGLAALVTLSGLAGVAFAPRLPVAGVTTAGRSVAAAVIGLAAAGFAWQGDAFLTTIVAGLAVGALFLLGGVRAYRAMAPTTSRIPLVHATYLDQPGERGAHALTSTILFRDDEVWKIYSPGFIPRFIYWLAFQAPFGYSTHRVALEAAIHRRNLAGKLTEYWFDTNRVSPALRVETLDGHLALVSHYATGSEPKDHGKARAFLFDLAERFDDAGLPTWQIDPRQPRSLGNALEGPDGRYTIIDLESGVVSPMASPRAWWRAVRRAQFPFYDDVTFDTTRAYVDAEEARMAAKFGPEWVAELRTLLDDAERAASEWHALEPRIWSRMLRWLWSGFGIPKFQHWLHEKAESSEHHAIEWVEGTIDTWEREGRITSEEAASLKASAESSSVQAVMPHFGVHLVIGMATRFPIGSITRASYTLLQLLISTSRFALRRTDLKTWRNSAGVHSPLVIVAAAIPGVGTFAYLLSWPMISRLSLVRVAADAVGEHLPFHIYRRSGVKRIIARPVRYQARDDQAGAPGGEE